MASITSELATLRTLSFRISSTPTPQLPQHVPAIAASLANCRTLLSSPQAAGLKTSSSESSVAVHKYRTLLSTLLQDRTAQGRWSAIVLIKATIEVGGWETLQKASSWVRGLMGILKKPDPPTTKKLCIITLTRIFILTRDYPTLVREITTPSLPTFVTEGLRMANEKPSGSLLQAILESFHELLPRHPTMFRNHLKTLQPFLATLIAPTPSSKLIQEQRPSTNRYTSGVTAAAQQLYVQTPCCAPKGASSEDWQKSIKDTIKSAHRSADRVFRAVVEDWRPSTRDTISMNGHTLDDEVQDLEPDMSLPPWSGLFAGSERLVQLLHLVRQHLDSPTASPIALNLAAIMDLTVRMLSLTVPASGGRTSPGSIKMNKQVSKDEQESLWLVLPDVHVATIEVLLALAGRSQSSTLALDSLILDQLVWVFGAEKDVAQIRTACYRAVDCLLERSGTGLGKSSIDSLVPLMRACCDDLLPSDLVTNTPQETPGQAKANGNAQPQSTGNADTFLGSAKIPKHTASGFAGLRDAAHNLLPTLLGNTRALYLSDSLRACLDRTAICTQHKDAMVASVLNPPPSKKFGKPTASILPLMARSFPADKDVEGMTRPRIPVIRLGGQDVEMDDPEEEDEVEQSEVEDSAEESAEEPTETRVEEAVESDQVDNNFVGDELDNILAGRATHDTAMTDANSKGSSSQDDQTDSVKRTLADERPSSPSKRVKLGEMGLRTTHAMPPAVATAAPLTIHPAAVSTTLEVTATSTVSGVPGLSRLGEAATGDLDSDDEDMVPLVLGQDTDDESD
jgi:pre-rRNA-processing protein RIX1